MEYSVDLSWFLTNSYTNNSVEPFSLISFIFRILSQKEKKKRKYYYRIYMIVSQVLSFPNYRSNAINKTYILIT